MNVGAVKFAIAGFASMAWIPWPESCRRIRGVPRDSYDTQASSARQMVEPADPIRMEVLDAATPPVFVLRGRPIAPGRLVFLHGMCGHGLGYAQSFQFSAAKYGTLIAPQGDLSCGGPWSKWSLNLDALDARIQSAFRALGHQDPIDDVAVLG